MIYEDLLYFASSMLSLTLVDIDHVCSEIIYLSTIRASDWNEVVSTRNSPKKHRTIDSFSDIDTKSNTRFMKFELHQILELVFGSQPTIGFSWHSYKFSYKETLLIALDYMANGNKYQKMKDISVGNWATYGYAINFFARFLYQKYYHGLTEKSMIY